MAPQPDSVTSRIARMGEMSDAERMALVEGLSNEYYSGLLSSLTHHLNNSESKDVRFAAAYLLGMYRMERSVRALSKQITLEAEITQNKRRPLWDRYPVAEALIRIGLPSIPVMLENIENSEDDLVQGLSARVIRYVQGPEIGSIIVERAIEKQADEVRKKRLQEALKYLGAEPVPLS